MSAKKIVLPPNNDCKSSASTIVCLSFMLILISSEFILSNSYENNRDKVTASTTQQLSKISKIRPQQQVDRRVVGHDQLHARIEQQQEQIKSDDYEKLTEEEEKNIRDGKLGGKARLVVPGQDTNSNSQVVYVNLDRVIKDKNETTRIVDNGRLIKQDSQIVCGETNRNGVPSMNPTTTSSETIQNRIVGGTKAEPGEFPYQVRLNIRSRRGSSLCGGVIIDQRHILTAAHCMTTW